MPEYDMFDVNTIVMFFTASVLLALAPGPDILYVMTQSMLKGRSAGIMVTFGLCTGLIGHTTAVAFGVAMLFQTSAVAFTVLKFAGAAYLLYLAWKSFSASEGALSIQKGPEMSSWYLYRRGVIMNITNPKVSIFFLAFLPQFSNPARGSIPLQLMLLGGMFILSALTVFSSISYLAGLIGGWFLKSRRAEKILNIAAGSVFTVLAVKLAMTRQ
jgi:threonine/homoserine/homoserine lactone efflux protein